MNNDFVLRARGLHKTYLMGRSKVKVLRGASLEARRGELLVVMGSSGSGKSTLLHLLGALDTPDKGAVEFEGRMIFEQSERQQYLYRNRSVGFIFQFYHLLPELNVLENVIMPRLVTHSLASWWAARRAAKREAMALLEQMGLAERVAHRPRELSGGERQRVAIARALMNRPALLLADEPTGNLDEAIGAEILRSLAQLNEAGQTIVMVTHDAKVAAFAHRRLTLSEGVLREEPGTTGRKASAGRTAQEVVP